MLLLLAALSAIGWIGGVMYTPAIPQIARDLETDAASAQFTLTVFLIVFALAQLLYGPLSDRYGRRLILIASLLIYGIGSMAAALAPTIEALTVARVVQGFGAVGGSILARAIARDIWDYSQIRQPMALINSGGSLAPLLSLATGGFIATSIGWQGVFWVTSVIAFLFLALTVFLLPETHKDRGAAEHGGLRMFTNFGRLLRSPLFMSFSLSQALMNGGIFGFMAGAPFVVIDRLGVDAGVYGVLTAVMPGGFIVGNLITSRLSRHVGIGPLILAGCSLSLACALVSFAFVASGTLSLYILYPLMMAYTMGVGINVPNSMAGAIEVAPDIAGTAASLLGMISFTSMALGSLLVGSVETGDGLGVTGMLAVLAVPGFLLAVMAVVLARRSPAHATP